MSELALGVIAVVIAAASLYFKYRADRQKARDDARAHLRVEPEYYNDRIMLYSEGPAHAEAPRVTGVKFGPRSRMKPKKLLEQWGLSSILPAGSKYPLPFGRAKVWATGSS